MTDTIEVKVPGAKASKHIVNVKSPYDLSLIGQVKTVDQSGIETALDNAYRIFKNRDRWLSASKRIEILSKTADIMQSRFEILALAATQEGGKPLLDSRIEVARAIDGIHNCIECIRSDSGTEIPMGINAASMNRVAFTTHEPIGVVVSVSAFNHPLNLIVHQVGPAIASGCPVIVKPAEDTPLSCFSFVDILREAGFEDEYCQPLLTDNLDTATALVSDSRVAFFSFIGSAKVGWMLRSKLAPGARCALEHGGAAPVIIDKSADLEDALPLLAKGGFYHAGQVCVSVQRVYAHSSIAQQVADTLAELGSNMNVGDPSLESTEIGPIIRPAEVDRIDSWVQEAVGSGAKLLCGGKKISDTCYAATVLLNPPNDSKVSTLEIFGPVICVYAYDDIDQALAQANQLNVAFQASVISKDIDAAMYAYKRLDAATVMINDHTAFRVDWMPFAGLKESGHGVGGIPHTYHDMQIEKLMVLRSKNL